MLNNVKDNIVLFIVIPAIKIINKIIEIHFLLKALYKLEDKLILFMKEENHDIIEYLINNDVINELNIEVLNFDLIPIDIDLLSLERDNCIKEIYIDKNYIANK